MTTAPLRLCSTFFLHIQDGLLPEEDEHLPFAGHVVSALQHLHFVENVVFIVFMRAQEVIVSDPERQIVVGAVDAVKAVCMAVRGFISPVQAFNHLLERPVFGGNSIVVGKSNDLGDFKGKVSAQLFCELHCGKRIRTVSVRNEPEVLRQFCEISECHTHCEDTGAYAAVIRHLISDDGACGSVHDEPDVVFDATDFDVCLVSREYVSFFVGVLVNKGLDADGGSFTVVGDLLVGDADVVKVFQSLRSLAKGKAEIDMECEAQGHNMSVMLTEFQGRGIPGECI